MQVILKPVSHPELGEIVIRDSLFPIGRHEAPFSDYGADVTAKLSRRHARIFEQDGAVYLVDLGSLNGTAVNGVALDKRPARVSQNDEITFGGYLSYRAELLGRGATGAAVREHAPGVVLTLLPEHPESGVEPLVVSQFPFLVSKADEAFARYRQRYPEELRFLSRRHAHIYARDHELFVEDLGSTNGTFLAGERLDEQARALKDGDLLAFGGQHFEYRVHIKVIDQTGDPAAADDSVLTEALSNQADITRTTFVTSANSFIDIFCSNDESDDVDAAAEADAQAEPGDAEARAAGGQAGGARKGRVAVFARELRRAFLDDETAGRRRSGRWVALVVLAAVGVGGFAWYQGAPRRAVGELMNAGDFTQSAARADAWLAHHPDDSEIAELAATATMRSLTPEWPNALDADRFDAARAVVAGARARSAHNPAVEPLLDLLNWTTDLEQFIQERGGVDAPIVMFQQEARIGQLLDWWDSDASERQQAIERIKRYEPAFEGVLARALSHLRTLHSEKSLYLAAIDEFKQTLTRRLDADDVAGLPDDLSAFSAKYPRVGGVDVLAQDIRNYLALDTALHAHDWGTAIDAVEGNRFFTPLFRDKVAQLREQRLPPKVVAGQFQEAQRLWRQGDGDGAVRLLESISGGQWGQFAAADLTHKRAVLAGYRALAGDASDEDRARRLVAFHASLDPVEDVYFRQALNKDFQKYREALLKEADAAFDRSRQAWEAYDRNGRILGLLRLEADVSQKFKTQAGQLSAAYDAAHSAAEIHTSLETPPAADNRALYATIVKECRLQRRSLQELGMVLDAGLLRAKLGLLPQPAEDEATAATAAAGPN